MADQREKETNDFPTRNVPIIARPYIYLFILFFQTQFNGYRRI